MSLHDEFPDGIKEYESFLVRDMVYFPKGRACCKWCKFCIYNRNTTSSECAVTGDTLYAIDKGVGIRCPLERIEKDDSI